MEPQNDRLIAAATQLLEACISAENWLRELSVHNDDEGIIGLLADIRDAIANATSTQRNVT